MSGRLKTFHDAKPRLYTAKRSLNEPKGIYPSRWDLTSESSGNKYIVAMKVDGTWACSCPQWKFRRMECKHIQEVKSQEPRATEQQVIEIRASVPVAKRPPQASSPYFVMQTKRAITLRD